MGECEKFYFSFEPLSMPQEWQSSSLPIKSIQAAGVAKTSFATPEECTPPSGLQGIFSRN
jgi:hypothetical protein